jgi:hypothetical protein
MVLVDAVVVVVAVATAVLTSVSAVDVDVAAVDDIALDSAPNLAAFND